jgi:hypothetical protein
MHTLSAMAPRPDDHGRSAPALPVDVVAVVNDTTTSVAFRRFPGAQDVVVVPSEGAWRPLHADATWWLVSPSGHRVAAVEVTTDADVVEIHLAVGERDAWLVHPGHGWLLEPADPPEEDGVEGLLVRMTEPSRGRGGVTLYFAVDQAWAPLVRGAVQLALADVPGHPCGLVERCVETVETGQVPQMMVDVHLRVDPVLTVGAVYRLQPRLVPPLRLVTGSGASSP